MPAVQDAPLDTLFLPFAQGSLRWPDGKVLFLRAREGWALRQHAQATQLVCEQDYRPFATALQQGGWEVRAEQVDSHDDPGGYALVLVLPPRQREEARALLARALALAAPGGVVVACQANNEGARSGEDDLRQLTGLGGKLTKHHCRVYWTAPLHQTHDAALQQRWAALDAPRPILDGRFRSRPGVFAWDRIDPASALLAAHLPADLRGRAADLGAGYGYLSAELLARCPQITALDLFEADARALALARHNLAQTAATVALGFHWHDVTVGLPAHYDVIVSNPPFHAPGRMERPDIGRRFIAVAAQALAPGGRLYLVANRHLPYEAVLDASFGATEVVATRDGFKLICAVRSRMTERR
ncbi:methyltransferase [Xanthomonas albilineans]|uniref:Probable ribosomal rna small subunit methyltransferase c protein n=1 Tax=Xanthomonas albilineans (strain GPE PC73 / CFBP 7063) TaxID=380358 RepID=D2UG92_XANAP|nr:methyltransferase [Xanthomonas albilineans]QHQ29655.1 putative ribosomal RNA small subunit methyltransferase c protein [Xanthomonas albilineans]CBA17403.1 probable ribosomal rna small subunit methyltransferase c protein [Xanthomonas albilineans GPE PC73]